MTVTVTAHRVADIVVNTHCTSTTAAAATLVEAPGVRYAVLDTEGQHAGPALEPRRP